MKSIKSIISVILVFTMAFTFIACNEDEGENTTAEISTAPATAPESASDHITEELAETNASIEDSADEPAGTNEPAEDTAEPEETEVPAEDTAAPETKAPADDTTKAPTTAPAEDTTKAPTTKPVEDTTTAPVTTAPIEDPSVDYSEWGKHGFERLLPIPLPFSDEEADWRSRKLTSSDFELKNFKMISIKNLEDVTVAMKAYVESFEEYGYTVTCEEYRFIAALGDEQFFYFQCDGGYVYIRIHHES